MCGIVGAVAQRNVVEILLEGLQRLEYRGYDSAGLAVINPAGHLERLRTRGKVQALKEAEIKKGLKGFTGVAHTRWATHGEPTEENAHPHISGPITVVHNGIIENYQSLKDDLVQKGHRFTSDTDTEVIAHLIQQEMQEGADFRIAVKNAKNKLRGTYGMVAMHTHLPDTLMAARSGSPLAIGIGKEENFIASDILALLSVTRDFIHLEEEDFAEISKNKVRLWDKEGEPVLRPIQTSNAHYDAGEKGDFAHYMLKEIFEQPNAIRNTLQGHIVQHRIVLPELGEYVDDLKKVEHIQIVACGTAYNAGLVARYWFESLAGIPCDVDIASEFRYRNPAVRKNSLFISLSQSGETADTLAAFRMAKELGFFNTLAICNVPTSSLVREADMTILTRAGVEIGVASTKAFTTQLVSLLLLTAQLIRVQKGNTDLERQIVNALQVLPNHVEAALEYANKISELARYFADKKNTIFLGRGPEYPIAVEAALKLKEISYVHAEAYAAGELKHGPLALIDGAMPVVFIAPDNGLLEKLKSNIAEVQARGGDIILFTEEGSGLLCCHDRAHVISLPHCERLTAPIYFTIPTQLFAYYVALVKGTNIDQPRNLAKSVTVE